MKIFLTTILIVINLFSQDIDTNLQLTTTRKRVYRKNSFQCCYHKKLVSN
ncbi:hypothetical protein ACOAJ8_02510 [Arcobacter cryaerophilus gv. pseudocryaerophilus]